MSNKTDRMYARIREHGEKLLKLFPDASIKEPVLLSKRAFAMERLVHQAECDDCNGPPQGFRSEEEQELWTKKIEWREERTRVNFKKLFGVPLEYPFFINGDPRGYTLKVKDDYMCEHSIDLPRDWGGYGIIAPDLMEVE